MGVILDTSVLIAVERGTISISQLLENRDVDGILISAISVSELLQGSLRSKRSDQRQRRAAFADWVTSNLPVVPFDGAAARRHADIWSDLSERGAMIGLHDLLIAATALAGGHAVATLDARDFSRVPGLHVLDALAF